MEFNPKIAASFSHAFSEEIDVFKLAVAFL